MSPHAIDLPSAKGETIYRIRVRGRVGNIWARRLGAMEVTAEMWTAGQVETVLLGRLADRVALLQVFEMLCELRLPVVSVECIEMEGGPGQDLGA